MKQGVFSKIQIQELELKNRIVRAATNDYCGNFDGTVSDLQREVYRELAKNEIGLIITGNYYVSDSGQLDATQNALTDDLFIPGASGLSDMIHKYHSKIIFQLSHAGNKSKIMKHSILKYENVSNLTQDEIMCILQDFVDASKRCEKARADGVELHFGHVYFLYDLLVNHPLGLEYAKGLFKQIRMNQKYYPILVKVNVDIPQEILTQFIHLCEEFHIWAIEITGSNFINKKQQDHLYYLQECVTIKKYSKLPLILTGGVRTMEDGEQVIDQGIELFAMSRPFICEPDLIMRWREQKSKCLSCNTCFHIYSQAGVRCILDKEKGIGETKW